MMTVLPKPLFNGLFALAAILNAAVVLVVIPEWGGRTRQFYSQDEYADGYDQLAQNLAKGNGYRMYPDTALTMVREPGYPILLAGIMLAFNGSFAAVKIVNALLIVGAACVLMRIARKVSSGWVLTLIAPVLLLLHPGILVAESRGGVEALFTFLLTLYVLTVYRAIESGRWQDYLLSGGVLGLTVLVKSTPMLFPLFLLGYLVVFGRRLKKQVIARNVSIMIAAMFTVLSPWVARNYLLSGKFVPAATVLGISAHAGQYVNTHLGPGNSWALADREGARERRRLAAEQGFQFKQVDTAYYQDFYSTADEIRFSNFLLKRVMGEYEQSPALFMRCVCSNLFNLWFRGKTWESTMINILVQLPYLILALVGIGLAIRNRQLAGAAPILLLLIYMIAVYVPILAQARYSVPLIPFVSLLACTTLAAAQERWTARRPAARALEVGVPSA
jgi:4-amino-4-deoxy-L-arabinose transferase-like glycosyltransferase